MCKIQIKQYFLTKNVKQKCTESIEERKNNEITNQMKSYGNMFSQNRTHTKNHNFTMIIHTYMSKSIHGSTKQSVFTHYCIILYRVKH